jgi:hypothetical protein
MAKREQRSNREKRKPKADKPAKVPLANASKITGIGDARKAGSGSKR